MLRIFLFIKSHSDESTLFFKKSLQFHHIQ